jgi:hypothetical protein
MPRLVVVLAVAALAGCGSPDGGADVLANFELRLEPRPIDGQDPFEAAPDVKLVTIDKAGLIDIRLLGSAQPGSVVEQAGFGPLDLGSVVGLLFEEPGGSPNTYDPSKLVAYGDIVLGESLGANGAVLEAQVLVPMTGKLGQLGQLSDSRATVHGGAALAPGGDVLVFGGAPDVYGATCYSRILKMADTDGGDWALDKIDEELGAERCAVDATTFTDSDGAPRVLVSGGRPSMATSGGSSTWAGVFDPVSEQFVWDGKKALTDPRSEHVGVAMADGRVLVVGGIQGTVGVEDEATFEIFNPDNNSFTHFDSLPGVGALGVMAASIGPQGVLICGGGVPEGTTEYRPVDTCVRVDPGGAVTTEAQLLTPTLFGTMTALADGSVLLTGGITTTMAQNSEGPTSAGAFLWDGAQWEPVEDMAWARSGHGAVGLPDGGALIVGGVGVDGPVYPYPAEARDCTEIYNSVKKKFSQGTCQSAGQGRNPLVATLEGEASFTLQGYTTETGEAFPAGGRAYGLVGQGPAL